MVGKKTGISVTLPLFALGVGMSKLMSWVDIVVADSSICSYSEVAVKLLE